MTSNPNTTTVASKLTPKIPLVNDACLHYLHLEAVNYFMSNLTEQNENVARAKLERMGFLLGQKLAIRYAVQRPRFTDHLDCIKFVCREFWVGVYKKQIDNLRTNHRGVYVLHDARFRWSPPVSSSTSTTSSSRIEPSHFLLIPCGMLRGCLAVLGISSTVTAEAPLEKFPACTFTIKITTPPSQT